MASRSALRVRRALAQYKRLVQAHLRQRMQAQPLPSVLERLVWDYPERGGRALRAGLCIATAQAFGASVADSLDSAASLELLHNAFLVHDDIEDGSDQRRGRPTLHKLHGVAEALNAGDALALLGLGPLLDNCATLGHRLGFRIFQEALGMVRETVEGQALELAWRRPGRAALPTTAEYLHMILKKTCWYTTIYPCRVGALIGSRDALDLDRFLRFGFFLGAAFQIQDDLLNLVGDARSYGKEQNGDLWEGKRTLMLVHVGETAPAQVRSKLRRLLAGPRQARTAADVRWLRAAIFEHGGIDYARKVAHALAGAAMHEHGPAFSGASGPGAEFLSAVPRWILERC